MTDPILIVIFICAVIGMVHSLWPVITGNPEWLRDRRSELAAAMASAALVMACFALQETEIRVVEKPIVVEHEPSAKAIADGYALLISRRRDQLRRDANARLFDTGSGRLPSGDGPANVADGSQPVE